MKGKYNMKKNYLTPELEKIVFSVDDIIATSETTPDTGAGGLPPMPINLMAINDDIDLLS